MNLKRKKEVFFQMFQVSDKPYVKDGELMFKGEDNVPLHMSNV